MNDITLDHPNVAIFPPVIPVVTMAVAGGLQWLAPLGWMATVDQAWRIPLGLILVVGGALTTISGRRALMRHGTNVNPLQPTTALVTEGAFRWTRNPLYVGVLIAMCGIAAVCALDWLLLMIIPSVAVLHVAVIVREERYLEQKFGEEYRRYKSRVPRYALTL